MNHLSFIFVQGLSGWGSYDPQNRFLPYLGMRGDHMALQGGLVKKHDIRGFYRELLELVTGL